MLNSNYVVEYTYYQYNSGMADNGVYTVVTKNKKTLQEAQIMAAKINDYTKRYKIDDEFSRCQMYNKMVDH